MRGSREIREFIQDSIEETGNLKLDWKDYVALSIASLETFLLLLVIFIAILVVLASCSHISDDLTYFKVNEFFALTH